MADHREGVGRWRGAARRYLGNSEYSGGIAAVLLALPILEKLGDQTMARPAPAFDAFSETTEAAMSDAAKIHSDLDMLTFTIDHDCSELETLTMSAAERKEMQHHIVRCLHSLREMEFVLEGQEPDDGTGADYLV
jgi:hypothetical protein